MQHRVTRISCVTLAMAGAAVSQRTPEELPKAATILDRHVAVTGGKKAYLALSTRKTIGKLAVDMAGHKFVAKVVKHAKAPGCHHMTIESDFLSQVVASDGEHVWQWRAGHVAGSSETKLLDGDARIREIERGRLHGPVQWRQILTKVETLGREKLDGKPAYKVRVKPKGGRPYLRFYDVASGRLVKYVRHIEMSYDPKVRTEVLLRDYREFDGVWLPTTVETTLHTSKYGSGKQTWTYDKIEHGIQPAASLFRMPKPLVKQLEAKRKRATSKAKDAKSDKAKEAVKKHR